MDDEVDTRCRYCGAEEQTTKHIVWECPCFAEERKEQGGEELANLPLDQIPHCVLLGIPPATQLRECTTFWGQQLESNEDAMMKAVGMEDPGPMKADARGIWRAAQSEELNLRQ